MEDIMEFDLLIGMGKEEVQNRKVYRREAVRAVLMDKDMIFMVRTVNGDFKFPGGGIEPGETHEDTLRRELLEETGCEMKRFEKKLGQITERRADFMQPDDVFEMVSHYYLCEGAENVCAPSLSDYEEELCLTPEWVSVEEAYRNNERILTEDPKSREWMKREVTVLGILYNHQNELR